jgi:hypothetical protein
MATPSDVNGKSFADVTLKELRSEKRSERRDAVVGSELNGAVQPTTSVQRAFVGGPL